MKDFTGRVAAVTGAGSGIGRALALRLAAAGAHVALADINPQGLDETQRLVQAKTPGVRVTTQVLDTADAAAVQAWADQVVADHGAVHLVVNNAGVALSGAVRSLSLDDYRWIMGINFWGVVHGTKAFLPHLEVSGEGHIVNISSVFGLTAQPLMSGYNASKFAVRGFTESLRQELDLSGSCVSTTCVHPGGIKTNIAQAARVDPSVSDITGHTQQHSTKEFERLFFWSPDFAARTILKGVQRNRRRVLIGADAHVFDLMARLLPTGYQRIVEAAVRSRSSRRPS